MGANTSKHTKKSLWQAYKDRQQRIADHQDFYGVWYTLRSRDVAATQSAIDRCRDVTLSACPPLSWHTSTLLHCAVLHRNLDAIQLLLPHFQNKNRLDVKSQKSGSTAMALACASGQLDVCEMLLAAGADLTKEGRPGLSLLHIAAAVGEVEIVEWLISKYQQTERVQLELNARDPDGRTPLHEACENGHPAVAKLLLKHGADMNSATKTGVTPLLCAARADHLAVVKVLLEAGADLAQAVEAKEQHVGIHRPFGNKTQEFLRHHFLELQSQVEPVLTPQVAGVVASLVCPRPTEAPVGGWHTVRAATQERRECEDVIVLTL